MRSRRLPYALPVVALAGLLLTSGCSSASTKPPTAGRTTTAASPTAGGTTGAPAPISGGKVHLTAYTDNDGPTSTVILTGAIGDYGKAQSVNPGGSVNAEHNGQLDLMLTHGSFRLDIAELDRRFVAVLARPPVNTTTCSGMASASEPVPVMAGSGTGSYKGISGTFTLTVTLDEVYRPAGCSGAGRVPRAGHRHHRAGHGLRRLTPTAAPSRILATAAGARSDGRRTHCPGEDRVQSCVDGPAVLLQPCQWPRRYPNGAALRHPSPQP